MDVYKSSDLVNKKHFGYAVNSVVLSGCVIMPAVRMKQQKTWYGGILDNECNEVLMARLTRGNNDKVIMGLDSCERVIGKIKPMAVAYGEYYYGGPFTFHYGHFLLEGLSRLPVDVKQRQGSIFLYHDVTNGN